MSTNGILDEAHLWIPVRPGVRLAARLCRPGNGSPPVPAILEYLPYRKRDGTAARDATTMPVFAAAGFAYLRVDIAGSGESDGLFDDEYSEQEMRDGEAVIAWIADQDWCDGSVGMIGISWGGFNGLQLAARRPPALKAVVSMCSTVDRYADDIHYMGGCLLTDNFNWGAQMTAYMTRPPDPALRPDWRERWLERIDDLPFLAADWLGRPTREAYWRHGSVCEDFAAIDVPVLAIGGWNDAYVNAPLALAEDLSGPVAALIGPWEHKYPHLSRILSSDFHGEVIAWFGHHLAGRDTGADKLPPLRTFMLEHQVPSPRYGPRKGRWIAEGDWPSQSIRDRVLCLSDMGLSNAPGQGHVAVATPLAVGAGAAYFCPGMRIDNELADDQADDDADSITFDSAPLAETMELLGRPVVEIAFACDRPVGQLVFRLCDVAPNGVSQRISYAPINLCHHAGHDRPEALVPGQPYRICVALNACAHRLRQGHRLRLAVSTTYWPVIWPSPVAATVTLDLAACQLTLPERHAETEIAPRAPGPAIDHPVLDAETLREMVSQTERRRDADGTIALETFDDYGAVRNAEHGLETGSSVAQAFTIRDGDPLSARHEARWQFTFARGSAWQVTIDSEAVMTCDSADFHLQRRVVARDNGEVVIDRTWNRMIARGFN